MTDLDISSILKSKKLFLFDMDGTLYIGDSVFDGARELVKYINSIGSRVQFLTNNSSRSIDKYVDKMTKLGFDTTEDDYFTSTLATVEYLRGIPDLGKIYALGTASFCDELSECGFDVTDKPQTDVDTLVMGFDTELCFRKLEDACVLLNRGVRYIATNPDLVCPTSYGFVPDCGSVAIMLENATGRKPFYIGKPRPEMALLSMKRLGFDPQQTVLIGDRIYTDIACGINAGISTVLVMCGETTPEILRNSRVKPHMVVDKPREILNFLMK